MALQDPKPRLRNAFKIQILVLQFNPLHLLKQAKLRKFFFVKRIHAKTSFRFKKAIYTAIWKIKRAVKKLLRLQKAVKPGCFKF